jgi:hypothetical protein
MHATILPDLARDTSRSIRRALERAPRGLSLAEFRATGSLCLSMLWVLRGYRDHHLKAALAQGVEAGAFREGCRRFLESADDCLLTLRLLKAAEGAPPPEDVEARLLSDLAQAEVEIEDMRGRVANLLEWVNQPPPPIDPKKLEESRAAYERGEYGTIRDDIARLEAGGDL